MDYNKEKQTVTIFTKAYKLDTLATRLSGLNASQLTSFFENRGMMLPRKMTCMALTSVLNDRIKALTADKLKKDYFQRLQQYDKFSEVQLLNLWNAIAWAEDFKTLRINFWKLVLINFVGLNLSDGEIQYLITLRKLQMDSFDDYIEALNSISREQANTFDGQDIDVMRETLTLSASASEMTQYAEKYSLEVPQRLSKAELSEYAYSAVKDDKKQPTDIKDKLESMNLTQLNNFCKEYKIDMQSNMTKQQIVNYMFFYLSQCEILTTSLKTIETLDIYEPLKFTVDLKVASPFGAKEPKKIIYVDEEEIKEEKEEAKEQSVKVIPPQFLKNVKKTEAVKEEQTVEETKPNDDIQEDKIEETETLEDDSLTQEAVSDVIEKEKEEAEALAEEEIIENTIETAEAQPAFSYESEPEEVNTHEEESVHEVVNEAIEEENDGNVEEETIPSEDDITANDEETLDVDTFNSEMEEIEETSEEEPTEIDEIAQKALDDAKAKAEAIKELEEISVEEERLRLLLKNFDVRRFADKKEERIPVNGLSVKETIKNDQYGSEELLKVKKGNKKAIAAIVALSIIGLAIIGTIAWFFLGR